MNETRRSIRTSITALILCFIMLVGTTFAWFTDEVTSANNIIKTGNLDIGMLWSSDNTNWNDTEGTLAKPVFSNNKWEPGYTEVRYIKVQNLGSLAFQYKMAINPTGTVGKLAEVIDVSYDIVTGNENFVAPTAADKQGSLTKVATLKELILADGIVAGGVLLPESESAEGYYSGEIVICISFHMQESAGNEYQNANIGGDFGINLYATQFDYENDSFDSSYDDEAEWPDMGINESASAEIDSSNLILGALTSEVTINGNGISATIPEDVKVEDGATSLQLTVKDAEADSNISYTDGGNAKGFDVHIAGIAADNTKPMIVNLGAVLPAGLSDTELKLYHTENGTPEEMTRVASASNFTLHNQYTYNAETGEVSIYVATFSVFSAVKTTASVWDGESSDTSWYEGHESDSEYTLNSAAAFAGFRDLVDDGNTFKGKTVKLGVDIDLADKLFNPISYGYYSNTNKSFMGTFDGQGYTVYNLYQNGWELEAKYPGEDYTTSTAGGGLFASVMDATIKNLTVSGAEITMECVDMGVVVGYAQGNCTFENIVVTDSKIANYQRYTGGVVGEVCKGNMDAQYTHIFRNIIVDSSVVVSSLWGDFDNACGGIIGGKWGDAKVLMQNINVAARIDAFSDVTAAYQWYAYRRCGMLIGHTEQNSPKSALNADAPFLTCENVNVYYGDWINYTYYQFDNQTDESGNRLWYSNYPWVRAQAGEHNGALSNVRYGNPIIGGNAINTIDLAEANKSDFVKITFNQLYGGGQGVYGKADHDGVKIHHLPFNATTIYFEKPAAGWGEDLKLQYNYNNNGDTWTTVVEGISLGDPVDTVLRDIYKVVVPKDADSFIITDGTNETSPIELTGLVSGDLYAIDREGKVQHCDYDGKYNTIYFYNNKGWDDVSLYYWYVDSQNDKNNWDTLAFPGEEMTAGIKDGNYDIYQFVVPSYAKAFIISNGTKNNQTEDILVNGSAGKIYDVSDSTTTNSNGVKAFKVGSSNYKEGYTKIYLKNAYKWDKVQAYYNIGASWIQSSTVTLLGYDGDYEYYSVEIPNFATKFNFSGEKNNGTGNRETTQDQALSNYASKNMITPNGTSNGLVTVSASTFNTSTSLTGYKQLYFKPSADWYTDGARFAVYAFKDGVGNKWYDLSDKYSDGSYKVWVSTSYNKIILCRMNPGTTANNFNNGVRWNQTADLTIPTNSNNLFTQNSGWSDNGKWSTRK